MGCSSYLSNEKYIEKAYHDNGKIMYKIQKYNDKIHGDAMYWDENGVLINEVEYSMGVFHGLWKEYHLNGNLKYSITYNSGLKSGYEFWYYENGNKKSESLYENDEIIVDTIRWDEKGILIYK